MSQNAVPSEADQNKITEEGEHVEEEEEAVDIELQKAMQNAHIDESVFQEKQVIQKKEEEISKMTASTKKLKKSKGEDFLDYANKKGIQVSIEYEEDKYGDKSKKQYDQGKVKSGGYSQGYGQGKKPKYYKGYKNQKPEEGGSYYNNKYNVNKIARKMNQKFGNNKFDVCNAHIPKMMYYDPFVMQECMYSNNPIGYPQFPQYPPETRQSVDLSDDQAILLFIEHFFSLESLNEDLYIRNRLDDNGFIDLYEIANYNTIKERQITFQHLSEILSTYESEVIEVHKEEDRIHIRSKDWDNLKNSLLTKEMISLNKKNKKRQENLLISGSVYPNPQVYRGLHQMMGPMTYPYMPNTYLMHSHPPQSGYLPQMYVQPNEKKAEASEQEATLEENK